MSIQVDSETPGLAYVLDRTAGTITLTDTGTNVARVWSVVVWPSPDASAPTVTSPTLATATVPLARDAGCWVVKLVRIGESDQFVVIGVPDEWGFILPSPGLNGALLGAAGWAGRSATNVILDAYLRQMRSHLDALLLTVDPDPDNATVTGAVSVSILGGAGIASVDDDGLHVAPTIIFSDPDADPSLTHVQRATTGASTVRSLNVTAQAGRPQTGGAANNDGSSVAINAGVPGTGGAGAAGHHGDVSINIGANLGVRVAAGNLNGGGAETETHLDFSPDALATYIRVEQKSGTGTSDGAELDIVGQPGQAQTGGAANTDGGDVNVFGGNHGTGGGGAAGVRGGVVLGAGSHSLVRADVDPADTTRAFLTAQKNTLVIRDSNQKEAISLDGAVTIGDNDQINTVTAQAADDLHLTGLGSVAIDGNSGAGTVLLNSTGVALTGSSKHLRIDSNGVYGDANGDTKNLSADVNGVTCTGSAYTLVPSLAAITRTTQASGKIDIAFAVNGVPVTTACQFAVFVDGVISSPPIQAQLGLGLGVITAGMFGRATGLSAGAHTIDLRYKNGAAGLLYVRPAGTSGATGEQAGLRAEVVSA